MGSRNLKTLSRRRRTILHTESSRGWGGQERRILAEAQTLKARGHTLLLACHPESQLYLRAAQAGLAVHSLPFGGRGNISAFFRLRELLRQAKVEVLNTHSSLDSWVGTLAWKSLRHRPLLLRTRHLSTPVSTHYPTRWLYHRPAAVITTSEAIKTLLQSRLKVPEDRLVSIPTGIDLREFAPQPPDQTRRAALGFPPRTFLFGTVAVLRSWKGHLHLLEATKLLLDQGAAVGLLLVGDGPYRPVIEQRLTELALHPHVRLVGYQEDVASWLSLMDAFVFPSYANEGVPQAVVQALAMGKPVVATHIGGLPEVIIPGRTGILTPPQDPRTLAQAMGDLLHSPEKARRFGEQGRRLVAARYSLDHMAAALEHLYDSLSPP